MVAIGLLDVPPESDAWRRPCQTPDDHQIAFPMRSLRTAVRGLPSRQADRVITPMHAMFSNAGWTYTRELVDERGERSIVFQFAPEVIRSAMEANPSGFAGGVAPISERLFVRQQRLYRAIRAAGQSAGEAPDPLWIEEEAAAVLHESMASGQSPSAGAPRGDMQRADTAEFYASAVRDALRYMEQNLHRRVSLADVGRSVRISPAHFARIFRANTGETIARTFHQMRLRRAFMDVLDTRDSLWQIAARWGFADLAQLSRAFAAAFGRPPSKFR